MTFQNSSIVLVDPNVSHYETLLKGVNPDADVFVLDANGDGIKQVTDVLADRHNIHSLHILSHGQPGGIQLGKAQLTWQTIDRYTSQLVNWAKAFADHAEILLYGCEVAMGERGNTLLQQLSQLTGAGIAASTTPTGHAALGGDWNLETQTRSIQSSLAFHHSALKAYPGVLATALPNLVYAADDLGSTNIQVLSLTTGQASKAGTLAFPTFALSRQAGTGRVYYVETAENGRVGYWNPVDNTNTVLGRTGVPVEFLKLAQAVDGTLYGLDSTTPNLYAINPNTGAARLVGAITGGTPAFTAGSGDIAFDPQNPDRFFINVATPTAYRLYSAKLSTLKATYIGEATGLNATGSGGLAFGQDGQLYATSTVNGTPRLYRLDQTNATPTLVGTTPVQFSDFSSLPTPTDTVDVQADVAIITKPIPGGPITYTVVVKNNSNLDLSGITVDAAIPPEITGVAWNGAITGGTGSFPQTDDQSGTGNNFDANVNLGAGATVTYTVTGTIAPTVQPGTVLGTTVTTAVPDGVVDPDFTNNSFTLRTAVISAPQAGTVPPTTIDAASAVFAPTPGCQPGRKIKGDNGNNKLTGGGNSNTILGLNGNDTLRGRGCDDRLEGGRGNDRLRGNAAVDRLFGNQGKDDLDGGTGNDILNGGLGDDQLKGREGIDLLLGRRGNDRLNGNGGNDRLDGNFGNDVLRGGTNNDYLQGQQNDDTLNGGRGSDTMIGGLGRDRLDGKQMDDLLVGGRAVDTLNGGPGGDFIQGLQGDDRLYGNSQSDTLIGGGNRDVLVGGLAADVLKGGPGRDRFLYRSFKERGDTIEEFQVNRDQIDLSRLFNAPKYSNSNRFDRYVKVKASNLGTVVQVDANGDAARGFKPFITLDAIAPGAVGASNFIV
jgi:uncharacterized repeat protein (TIGR01451 family)